LSQPAHVHPAGSVAVLLNLDRNRFKVEIPPGELILRGDPGTGTLSSVVGSGYRAGAFEVEAAYPPGSPPIVNGPTRCFPGELQRDDIPVPQLLRAH